MFSHLTDFGFDRDWKQAIGFYLAWLAVTLVGAMLVSGLFAFTFVPSGTFQTGFDVGVRVGSVIAFISVLFFSIKVSQGKGVLREFTSILLILLGAALALLGGGILGMIVPAYLTTRPKRVV